MPEPAINAVRNSLVRGRPFGDDAWTSAMADLLDLHTTLRPRGRPRTKEKE
jgi:putative transposase